MTGVNHLMFPKCKKLTGKNYSIWSNKILTISEFRDLDQIIINKEPRPANYPSDYDKRHKEALMLIKLSEFRKPLKLLVADTFVPKVRNGIIASILRTNCKSP